MTDHVAAYELVFSNGAANSASMPNSIFCSDAQQVLVTGTGADGVPRPLVPPSGYTDVPVDSIHVITLGTTDVYTVDTNNGGVFVEQDGAAITNTTDFIVPEFTINNGFNSGRIGSRALINFNGASRPASPTQENVRIRYAYQSEVYLGFAHFCEFEEHPDDTVASGAVRLAELVRAFQTGTNTVELGVDGGGNAVTVNHCAFAGIAPEGHVMIRPEDLGAGVDQIPANMTDNEVSRFRFHPSVFIPPGRNKYVRSISRQAVDALEVDGNDISSGGPLEITNVDSTITASNWLVVIDGAPTVVRLEHGAGDFRRPRDIWNNVWVPILNGSQSVVSATQFTQVVGNVGAVGYRWQFAEYFRCLPIPGTNVFQTGIA